MVSRLVASGTCIVLVVEVALGSTLVHAGDSLKPEARPESLLGRHAKPKSGILASVGRGGCSRLQHAPQ